MLLRYHLSTDQVTESFIMLIAETTITVYVQTNAVQAKGFTNSLKVHSQKSKHRTLQLEPLGFGTKTVILVSVLTLYCAFFLIAGIVCSSCLNDLDSLQRPSCSSWHSISTTLPLWQTMQSLVLTRMHLHSSGRAAAPVTQNSQMSRC